MAISYYYMYLVKFVCYLHNSTRVPVVEFWPLSLCHATPREMHPLSRRCVTEREGPELD